MIADATKLEDGAELQADVCIVGAGMAGITLALELRHARIKVLVLESGGWRHDGRIQALYQGEVADERMHSPTDRYRRRVLGGSGTIWGGRCIPFDAIDFETRPYIPDSGWPLCHSDLLPYYHRANEWLEAGDFDYSAASSLPGAHPVVQGLDGGDVSTDGMERFSCPTDLARRYRHRLKESPTVKVLTHANCVGVSLDADGRSVRALACRTLSGLRFRVKARRYVLATGGLEVPRLLLASRDVIPQGVGNRHDVVGRYYMCHMASNLGAVRIEGPLTRVFHSYVLSAEGVYCRRRFSLPARLQRSLCIGNVVARLHFPVITDPAHGSSVLSALFLGRRFISYEYNRRLQSARPVTAADHLRHLRNIVTGPFELLEFLAHWLRRRTLAERKFPSVVLRNRTNLFSLDVHGEQAPNRESRVTLAASEDELGVPRIRVDWRYLPIDVESVRRTLVVLQNEFHSRGVGSLLFDEERLEVDLTRWGAYGGHHMGTARMGSDPRTSVVDADCRVHGTDNLYVAGSAVFPTSGQATPSLTLTALACRLAEHLKATVARETT